MNKNKIKEQLLDLSNEGAEILLAGAAQYDKDIYEIARKTAQEETDKALKKFKNPKAAYHVWYAKSYKVVRIFAPERLEEFEKFYTGDKTIKKIEDLNVITAGITHYLQEWIIPKDGDKMNFNNTFASGIREQVHILRAIVKNLDNPLFNMESDIHYGLAKSEIDIAKELRDNKFFRAAGAIAGVVIEGHLKIVVARREIPFDKKHTMSNYNDALKKAKIYTDSTWRLIQRCADIRNNCVHAESVSPDEIDDIIRAAEKIIAEFD